jgi:hypothetical protein
MGIAEATVKRVDTAPRDTFAHMWFLRDDPKSAKAMTIKWESERPSNKTQNEPIILVCTNQAPAPPLLRRREIARPKALNELRTILFSELA